MKRREFITLLGGSAVAWPLAARAQQTRRIAVHTTVASGDRVFQTRSSAFEQALRSLGWIKGQNLRIDYRWSADPQRTHAVAAEIAQSAPELIITGSTAILAASQRATHTSPIIFTGVSDPVAQGFVTNLTHPGGNITGFASYEFSIGGKWVDFLKQFSPDLTHVALVYNPESSPENQRFFQPIEAAASSHGLKAITVPIRVMSGVEAAIVEVSRQGKVGLIVPNSQFLRQSRDLFVEIVLRNRMPTIYAQRDFVEAGGLMRYGFLDVEQWRGAAFYVDRILKGATPGDLPVQLPTKYELLINLKAAQALGTELPMALMMRADEVIE